MQPFISIVIPVYNAERYINKCIDSVLNQSYTNWELLLINDGSSDDSGKICDSYSMKYDRIRTIHKPNEGVSSARNLGIEQASGDFITFIDSDDWVSSQYIADFVRCNPQKNSIVVSGLITKTPSEEYVSFQYTDESTMNGVTACDLIVQYDLFRDGGPCNKLFDLQLIKVNKLSFRTNLSYHGCFRINSAQKKGPAPRRKPGLFTRGKRIKSTYFCVRLRSRSMTARLTGTANRTAVLTAVTPVLTEPPSPASITTVSAM